MSFTSDFRAVVAHADFRKLYAPRLASQAADGLFQVALASYVFFTPEKQATAGAAAATFATLLLPYTFVGPFAGIVLDRWRRRHVLVRTNLVRMVLVALIAVLISSGVRGPAIFLTALLALSGGRFFLTAMSASLPHVVARRELVMANSVMATSGSLATLTGGGLGLALHQTLHTPTLLMAMTGVGYLLAACLAARMHPDRLGPHHEVPPPSARHAFRAVAVGLVEGGRHVCARPAARYALTLITAQRFCYGTGTIATLLLYRNYFHDPTSNGDAAMAGLGAVFAAAGLGYFVAAVITPEVTPRIGKSGWIVVSMLAASVFGFALVVPYQPPPLVLGAFLLGLAAQAVKICVDTIVQESIDDEFRGRVFSVYDVLFNSAFVSAAAVASLTMPESGKSYAILSAVSLGYAVAAVLYLRAVGVARPVPQLPVDSAGNLIPVPVPVEQSHPTSE
ncbi:MAG TPA: MFS transporter [Sporichthyaceae bacterium]